MKCILDMEVGGEILNKTFMHAAQSISLRFSASKW